MTESSQTGIAADLQKMFEEQQQMVKELRAGMRHIDDSMAMLLPHAKRNQADLDRFVERIDNRLEDFSFRIKMTLRTELDEAFAASKERVERRLGRITEELEQLKGKR
jgi:predicted transcriptional regulator